jgi:hypothetical protein
MLGPVKVEQGGEGEALSVAGEVLHIVIDRAYAPGAPISMSVARADGELGLRGKTIGSKRREDGRFDVKLRLVSLSRVDRERLAT